MFDADSAPRSNALEKLVRFVFSFENVARFGSPFSWEPERGTRLGVMPRSGDSSDVRWFETDACYVFHPLNAYEVGGEIVLDVARYEQLLFMAPMAARDPDWRGKNVARLTRWRIDLERGGVRSELLDDGDGEFPRIDDRRLGRKHRFGYVAATGPEGNDTLQPVFTAIRKYDLDARNIGAEPGARVALPHRVPYGFHGNWVAAKEG